MTRSTEQPLLTSDTHDCGSPIYIVGSGRKRFCVNCSEVA